MRKKSGEDADSVHSRVRKVRIDAEQAGQRIDNFLRRELPGLPKGRLYRVLRRGEVRVNGGRVRAEYKLQDGDEVRIPPARVKAPGDAPAVPLCHLPAQILTVIPTRFELGSRPSAQPQSCAQLHLLAGCPHPASCS